MNNFDARYRLSPFLRFDYKYLENSLSEMALKGWRIDRISGFTWKYKKADPEKRNFFITYASDFSDINYIHEKGYKSMDEIFRIRGWKKEAQWKQVQIFSTDENAVSLEVDEAVRLECVRMNMKKTFLPSWLIAFFGMLLISLSNGIKYFDGSAYDHVSAGWTFLFALYAAVICGTAILNYFLWIKISERNVLQKTTSISTAWLHHMLNILLLGFLVVGVAYFMGVRL